MEINIGKNIILLQSKIDELKEKRQEFENKQYKNFEIIFQSFLLSNVELENYIAQNDVNKFFDNIEIKTTKDWLNYVDKIINHYKTMDLVIEEFFIDTTNFVVIPIIKDNTFPFFDLRKNILKINITYSHQKDYKYSFEINLKTNSIIKNGY